MSEEKGKIIVEVDELEIAKEKNKTVRVLVFSLAGEGYCININQAKEVIGCGEVTRIPNTPSFISGVINLRGDIIALVDPRYFLDLEIKSKAKQQQIIVTDVTGSCVGILVDKIEDAIDVEEGLIQAPLSTISEKVSAFTLGQIQIEDRILTMLDIEKVLKNDEIKKLRTRSLQ